MYILLVKMQERSECSKSIASLFFLLFPLAKREPKSVAETLKSADDKQQRAASQALAQQVLARNRSSGGTQPSDPPQVPPVDEAHVEKMARLDELEMQERRKQELGYTI